MIAEKSHPPYTDKLTVDNETTSRHEATSKSRSPTSPKSPLGPKVGKLIDMDSPVHHPGPSSSDEHRPSSRASSKSTSGVGSGESLQQGEQFLHTSGVDSTPGTSSTPGTTSTTGVEQMPGAGSPGSVTGSMTTGSAHNVEAQQTFNNQAYDGMSVIESEQTTDVSLFSKTKIQHVEFLEMKLLKEVERS